MSLKARIEAVIYAAEEPVTLPQLASLFGEEALASRAERVVPEPDLEAPAEDALSADAAPTELLAENGASPAVELPPTESLSPETPRTSSSQEQLSPAAADPIAEVAGSPVTDSFPEGAGLTSGDFPSVAGQSPVAESDVPAPSVEDEKRAARQRDREIRDEIRSIVDELIADYNAADRGLEIREVAGGFRMATRAEYHDAVRAFVKSLKPPMKLSLQALETLAVIAYKQPVTAPEIGEIRGVDSGGVLGSLVARKLITTAGRKQVIGRPILYKTTREFLLRFGLKDLNELPSIEEFEKMAGELAETEEESAAIAPSEEELPFSQNEAADVEEAVESALQNDDGPPSSADAPPTSEHDSASDAAAPAEEKLP